ncbi:phage N-6-adenine-methyltransferase [Stenotrophomonas sp. LC732]|uniref:phage N-6-adenine-methyltransferase n=1 Tax=Stenotrophomonas TaxID=40323 RepID=UPI00040BE835|nr:MULTISPECIES: phage N-6-adenine-methyltransferase [Stenotrophomonas]MDG9764260.1 phage N-6-adenine-methyltransferase [Stenotrophomonas sp. GD04064]MDQ7306541.1 phage N-6-adenine-methyltransferase [Stenotrophomonas sp. Sm3119]MDZ5787436.1 phage N-6-adenine-methyltransferase [Stenotrophomonas maltophilia]UGB16402.1 phage N-6-adenine-methyltransferase [Stenotrophomonas maltophilia]UGB51280.1 phage N-6-adenine-methyltransferase [Stenotrophomonas maltophilia]
MNAAAHPFDPSALSLPKQRKNTSAPRATKLASAMVGYDRLPAAQSTDTWLTPPELIWGSPKEGYTGLGPFDLDPATPENGMPWPTAARMLKPSDDGLASEWPADAFVFMNPPFGRGQEAWMEKMANHPGGGIALVFARTETKWFQRFVLNHPNISAVVFQEGRLKFHRANGDVGDAPPAGPAWIAYGEEGARRLKRAVREGQIRGCYLELDFARVSWVLDADMGAANDE